jgi:asparagine synthase (glutamine-hydrolysing)
MVTRYLVLLKDPRASVEAMGMDLGSVQRKTGLSPVKSNSMLDVLIGPSTDVLHLPGGALVIGRLFTRKGSRVDDASTLSLPRDSSAVCRYFLEHFWGPYILIQTSSDPIEPVNVLRDPSGGLPCVASQGLAPAFITSDVSLPISLGFYERSIDWDYILHFLNYPHMKTEATALKGLIELLPGCAMRISEHATKTELAWSPWDFVQPGVRLMDSNQAARSIREAVEMAVRAMTADDASILLEISGGLDSSIVASCLAHTGANLTCSTLVTPVPGADERFYARLVASSLGAPLHVEQLEFGDALFDIPPDANLTSPAVTMLQSATDVLMDSAARRHAATCHLSGGGGDTVFGYLGNASPAADAFKAQGIVAARTAISDLAEMHRCTTWKAGWLALKKLLRAPRPARTADTSFLSPHAVISAPRAHPWHIAPAGILPGDRERVFDLAGTQSFIDGLPRSRLRTFHMPLLSQPVVETCLRVPSWMWIAGGINRAVAREAFADVLPAQILARRSKGTFAPFTGAIFRRSRHAMLKFLLEGELQQRGLLNTAALREFFLSEQHARGETFSRAFDLYMIENWIRHQP